MTRKRRASYCLWSTMSCASWPRRRWLGNRLARPSMPTALVHEAYLRLVGGDPGKVWAGRAQFFAAAAEAMRRILVEKARAKHRLKRGGQLGRVEIEPDEIPALEREQWDELLAIDGALDRLAVTDPTAAELVKLRYFAGFSIVEAAEILGVSPRTADRLWSYARAWLRRAIEAE